MTSIVIQVKVKGLRCFYWLQKNLVDEGSGADSSFLFKKTLIWYPTYSYGETREVRIRLIPLISIQN